LSFLNSKKKNYIKIEGEIVPGNEKVFHIGMKGTSPGTIIPQDVMNFLYQTFEVEAGNLDELQGKMAGKWWIVKPNTGSLIRTLLRGYIIIPLGSDEEDG
jgi:hypothetical protein